MTRSENMELVEVLERLLDRVAALDAAIASLSAPQPPSVGEVVVTRAGTHDGPIIAVTRQDREGQILSVIAEAPPPSTPVGVEWSVIVEGLRLADQFFDGDTDHWQWDDGEFFPADKVRAAYQAALAQQPASDGGFTAADMMDARQEGRKEAQQTAAVDGADAKDAEIEALRAEREVICAEAVKYADKSGRLEAKVGRLAEALREAMEWNWIDGDVPETIQDKARDALRDHDQEVGNG